MIEFNDVEQMAYLFGVGFDTVSTGNITKFEIPMFGTRIIFLGEDTTLTGTGDDSWRTVCIRPSNSFEEKRMEVIWELMHAGYMHYLRIEVPRTFREMITSQGWDRKIIEKRLELYGDAQKYDYLRKLNRWASTQPATYMLATDPGFFDFLV